MSGSLVQVPNTPHAACQVKGTFVKKMDSAITLRTSWYIAVLAPIGLGKTPLAMLTNVCQASEIH